MSKDNIIYIGNKPLMNYVFAVVTQMNDDVKIVTLKARGKAINRAVDVAEVVRNRFLPDCAVHKVRISTDQIDNDEGGKINVSVIEIKLRKR